MTISGRDPCKIWLTAEKRKFFARDYGRAEMLETFRGFSDTGGEEFGGDMEHARNLGGRTFLPDTLDWYVGPDFSDRRDMISAVFGRKTLPYGSAMAYLFRRFGYPEWGWDDYKELTSWVLTTPSPDILVRITPYVGNDISISVRSLLSKDLSRRLRDWEMAPNRAWDARFEAHLQDLPRQPWFDNAEELSKRFMLRRSPLASGILFLAGKSGDLPPEIDLARAEARAIQASYVAHDPFPGMRLRPENISDFDPDDPLREIGEILVRVAKDLRRGVGVRDAAINLFGAVEVADVAPHPVSGHAFGLYINDAPQPVHDLMQLVQDMGGGDIGVGFQRACAILAEHVQEFQPHEEKKDPS